MSKSKIFDYIPRSEMDLDKLREERKELKMDYVPFEVGEEVICIFGKGTSNLRDGHVYTVKKETKDTIIIEIDTGHGKGYFSEYKKWRFTFPSIKQKCREIKIDSIV